MNIASMVIGFEQIIANKGYSHQYYGYKRRIELTGGFIGNFQTIMV